MYQEREMVIYECGVCGFWQGEEGATMDLWCDGGRNTEYEHDSRRMNRVPVVPLRAADLEVPGDQEGW